MFKFRHRKSVEISTFIQRLENVEKTSKNRRRKSFEKQNVEVFLRSRNCSLARSTCSVYKGKPVSFYSYPMDVRSQRPSRNFDVLSIFNAFSTPNKNRRNNIDVENARWDTTSVQVGYNGCLCICLSTSFLGRARGKQTNKQTIMTNHYTTSFILSL